MKTEEFCKMISLSKPGPGDGGNTGSWRVLRPVINLELCIPVKMNKKACFNCWLYCLTFAKSFGYIVKEYSVLGIRYS